MIWLLLAASVLLPLAGRTYLPRLRSWRAWRQTKPEAARILAGRDLDLALKQLLWDEGFYYGEYDIAVAGDSWDCTHWLDDAPREGGGR